MSARPRVLAQRRQLAGKAVARLRRQGILPGVVYGHGVASESIQVDAREFENVRRHAGRNALLDLALDGGRPRPVMVHAVQEHPVSRKAVHVDFFTVRMTEEMVVDVPIVLVGESPAVERMGGTLLHLRNEISVRALPGSLPQSAEVDISRLETFDDALHVSDIVLPDGVTLLTDPEEQVARVLAPRIEEEEVAAPAAVETPPEDAVPEVGEEEAAS